MAERGARAVSAAGGRGGSASKGWENGRTRSEGGSPSRTPGPFSGLTALGWDDRWVSALFEVGDPVLWPARVSRVDRGMCTVMTGSAEVRLHTVGEVEVAVGDWVAVAGSAADNAAHIAALLPRRSAFRRAPASKGAGPKVVAANIDTVFICDALDGSLGLRHLERFLALAWQSGATPVVVITKADAAPSGSRDAGRGGGQDGGRRGQRSCDQFHDG